jgi:hypothetical protein
MSVALHASLLAFRPPRVGPATVDATPSALSGETLDVEPSPAAEDPPTPDVGESKLQALEPNAPPPSRRDGPHAHLSGPNPSPATAASASLFGAVGVPYAADLVTTFTRALPQAASADPVWLAATLGSAGSADLTLVLDEDGRLADELIAGRPSTALRRAIERTIVLVGSRSFTAKARATRLRITARVTTDDVRDGLHGDVFALGGSGGSFSGELGTAFFAIPAASGPGRRIDVELRVVP